MIFVQLLKSLDDLLYEIMSWLIFYPMTLWRSLRRPLVMMDYSDRELRQSDTEQYVDTLRPPLFLFLSLMLMHMIELAAFGDSNPIITSKHGLAALVTDDTSLVLLRLVIFSVFPLMFATRLVRLQRKGVTRLTLKAPFYAQCYAAAPFALLIGIGGAITQLHWRWTGALGGGIILIAFALYWIVQARWFSQHLHRPALAGCGHAVLGMIESLVILAVVLPLFV